MARTTLLLAAITTAPLCAAQTGAPRAAQSTSTHAPVRNDAFQGGWSVAEASEVAGLWQRIASDPSADKVARLNHFRSERNASLARNQGTLTDADLQRLEAIAAAIAGAAPKSFEDHLARYYQEFPAASAFEHLTMAKALEPDRPELIAPALCDAARRFDAAELVRQGKALRNRGAVAPALWAVAEDMLLSVERDGVLLAAGEMDAYPLWALQAEGKRRDVLVVDSRLLADKTYRERVWKECGASGPPPPASRDLALLAAQSTARPVHLSLALGRERLPSAADRLYLTGLTLRVCNAPIDNIPLLEERWPRMHKRTDAGPLSRNYLLVGAVLLRHYRAIGDEGLAARTEHQLRTLAKAMGATDALYRSGVLEH